VTLRHLLISALMVGVFAGALGAVVLPRGAQAPAQAPSGGRPGSEAPDPLTAPVGDPRRPEVAAPARQPRGESFVVIRARSRPVIEVRARDPLGGPDWAIRTFRANREAEDRPGRPIGRNRCAQLGRLHHGRFGWIDGTNVFRPARIQYTGAPLWCGSRRPDLGGEPHFDTFTRITNPDRGAAAPIQSVAWGVAGPTGTPIVKVSGRQLKFPKTPTRPFLVLGDAQLDLDSIRLEVRYPTRPTVRRGGPDGSRPFDRFRETLRPENRPDVPKHRAQPTLAVRAPDPGGGLPWGLEAIPAQAGGWCVSSEARIVGDRTGSVDAALGTFTPQPVSATRCPTPTRPLTRRKPLDFSYGGGGIEDLPGRPSGSGRRIRRTLPGRFSIAGRAHSDVRDITIATPRDVRTLRPAPDSGAFLAVYDGGFPTGEIVLTSRLRGGAARVQRFRPEF
jgi:hypothetical protein